jgi:dihydrofolate synthase/folylpolyglutamate synthase
MSADIDHPLMRLPKFGKGTGLHRVSALLEMLEVDVNRLAPRAIAVTGSNGKGSTARIASELLRCAGDDVGLFTSPHLFRYSERFQVNGVPAADDELVRQMDRVYGVVQSFQARTNDVVGAFEAQFVVALCHFLTRDVRWMVLEAGIGGRYDPVRIARADVMGLVSLDLEHTELLGETLEEIACDKLDAAPPGATVFLGESCLPQAAAIKAHAQGRNLQLEFITPDCWRDHGLHDGWQHFDILLPGFSLTGLRSRLIGRHQLNNHAVAISLCRERLQRASLWPKSGLEEVWRQALEQVRWPGRLEQIDSAVTVDVGHSPAAIQSALDAFLEMAQGRPTTLVTGASKNKNAQGMIEILARCFSRIICTRAHHNGRSAEEIRTLVKEINPNAETIVCADIEEAARMARAEGRLIYVAGGLFLAIEFAHAYRGNDPRKLRFF